MTRLTLLLALMPGLCNWAAGDDWGSATGQFVMEGDILPTGWLVRPKIPPPIGAPGWAALGVPEESLIVDSQTRGIANVFVFLTKSPHQVHPDFRNIIPSDIPFRAMNGRFDPHCLILRTDQAVAWKAGDPEPQNVLINPFANRSVDLDLPSLAASDAIIRMPLAERMPMPVRSQFYPWMTAYWLVLDHPYAALTDKTGKFTIENLPAGNHEFRVWHERSGTLIKQWPITVRAGEVQVLPVQKLAMDDFVK